MTTRSALAAFFGRRRRIGTADPDWRFHYFRKKQLAVLAKLLACPVEDLMDICDEGVTVGAAYGENLAKRLRLVYRWTPDRIEQTLSHLKSAP